MIDKIAKKYVHFQSIVLDVPFELLKAAEGAIHESAWPRRTANADSYE